jgi:hypothetical protein
VQRGGAQILRIVLPGAATGSVGLNRLHRGRDRVREGFLSGAAAPEPLLNAVKDPPVYSREVSRAAAGPGALPCCPRPGDDSESNASPDLTACCFFFGRMEGPADRRFRACKTIPSRRQDDRSGPICFVAPPQHEATIMPSSARLASGPTSVAGLGPEIVSQARSIPRLPNAAFVSSLLSFPLCTLRLHSWSTGGDHVLGDALSEQ